MSHPRTGQASYGKLAPVRPPSGGRGGIRPGGSAPRQRTLRDRALAKDSPLRHVDWALVAAVLALSLMGTLLVWSATQPGLAAAGANPRTYLEKQLLNVGIGLVLMVAVSVIDYRLLRVYAPLLYGLACLGLLVVLSPLGSTVNGAHSWIALPGGFEAEPSEFAKIGMILMVATILGELRDRAPRPGLREAGLALACGAIPLALVVLQPDLGVVILMVVMLVGMIALSGIRLRWLAGRGVVAALAGLLSLAPLAGGQHPACTRRVRFPRPAGPTQPPAHLRSGLPFRHGFLMLARTCRRGAAVNPGRGARDSAWE